MAFGMFRVNSWHSKSFIFLFTPMSDALKCIVVDFGSSEIKVGFAEDEFPRVCFPSVVGYWKRQGPHDKDVYVGDEALSNAASLVLKHPIGRNIRNQRGVSSWDQDEEILWEHIFNTLSVDLSEYSVLFTSRLLTDKGRRDKYVEHVTQLLFDRFGVSSLFMAPATALALYGSGRTTGVVVDCGNEFTDIQCIYEGWTQHRASERRDLAGRDITEYLDRAIFERHATSLFASAEKEIVRVIKEKCAYVALDFDKEMWKAERSSECNIDYPLPDGNVLTIGEERFCCSELLFRPYLNGFEFDGIAEDLFHTIEKWDHKQEMYANIVLSGGTTMLPGFPERIEREIVRLTSPTTKVKVVAPPERKHTVWIGGSIIACHATFPDRIVTRELYNDAGPQFVNRKCFL